MRNRLVNEASVRDVLISPDALDIILCEAQPMAFLDGLLARLDGRHLMVHKSDVLNLRAYEEALSSVLTKPSAPRNKRHANIEIVPGSDVTGESRCEGKMADFAEYFKARYNGLRGIIEGNRRREIGGYMPIDRAMRMNRDVKIIGMVSEHAETKNGHRILTVEDLHGSCKILIPKDSEIIGESIVNDEVLGIVGKPSSRRDMIIASALLRPEILPKPWKVSDSVSSVAFLGDVHVGSNTFLDSHWKRMVKWMKKNAHDMDLDYLILPGDVVDGIGIYPNQENELIIADIYQQYERLAEMLKEIPDHIHIVIQPGNHDAVRPAEPQPALSGAFTKGFDSNVIQGGNPAIIKIEGRNVLSYHGRSLDDWIASVQHLSYEEPLLAMKEMLSRRHLAPIYGNRTPLAPEKKDYMLISDVPDIFVTGHVHGAHMEEYRGVRMVNASTWQSQTAFQRMHNFHPDPAVLPIVHLGNGQMSMQSFS